MRIDGQLKRETDKAYLVEVMEGTDPVWLPKSQLSNICVEAGSRIQCECPDWLLEDKA